MFSVIPKDGRTSCRIHEHTDLGVLDPDHRDPDHRDLGHSVDTLDGPFQTIGRDRQRAAVPTQGDLQDRQLGCLDHLDLRWLRQLRRQRDAFQRGTDLVLHFAHFVPTVFLDYLHLRDRHAVRYLRRDLVHAIEPLDGFLHRKSDLGLDVPGVGPREHGGNHDPVDGDAREALPLHPHRHEDASDEQSHHRDVHERLLS